MPETSRSRLDAEAARRIEELASQLLSRRPTSVGGLVDLVSNDYLGLRRDPRVIAAATRALESRGLGAGAARLLGGDCPEHVALEESFAKLQGEEAGVLFPSGTAANQGTLGALLADGDLVISDEQNHASIVDGIRLSRTRRVITPHGDVGAVDRALAHDPGPGARWIVVEGIHGMDGDLAPLAALADVCRKHDARMIVDEAHAVGLVGPDGAGAVAMAGCEDVVAARVNPLGKSFGGAGGVVTASRAVCELLVNRARTYVFATAPPPSVAAGVVAALEAARAEPWRRERALQIAGEVARRLDVTHPDGAIVPWLLGTPDAALTEAAHFRERGFAAHAVRPPTVPVGTARLRLSLHADLSDADATRLFALCGERRR
ncbi:MAG: 8-amino-7-oxononanoate synthase [Acidobacteriota bacterium]